MQLFGNLDILSYFRISRFNCVGCVRRMDSIRIVKYAIIIPREVDKEEGKKSGTKCYFTIRYTMG